jgi:hypothetical protein
MARIRQLFFVCGVLCGITLSIARPAHAQDFGVRGGISANPDQVFFGAHVESLPIVDRVHLRPNIELGFGDDVTLFAVNLEAIYKWPLTAPWTVYAGAGPAINIVKAPGETDAEAGINFLGGLEHKKGWFVEAKVGAVESTDLKIMFGYTFRR